MADSGTNGGGSGGSSFDGKIKEVKDIDIIEIINYLPPYSEERFIQECAIRIFANMNFDGYGSFSENECARKAVSRAKTLAQQLKFGDAKFKKIPSKNNENN